MARLAGVDLPAKKRTEIGLTYIYGIGRTRSKSLCHRAGINPDKTKDEFPPIKLERTKDTKLSHKDGTISMARDDPDTATSDFFICVGDQPELDFGGKRNPDGQGFAAFGRVVRGMDVVRKIQAAPADGQKLTPPVKILTARRKP